MLIVLRYFSTKKHKPKQLNLIHSIIWISWAVPRVQHLMFITENNTPRHTILSYFSCHFTSKTQYSDKLGWHYLCVQTITDSRQGVKVFKIVLVSRFLRKSIYYEYCAAGNRNRIQRLQCQMPIRPLCQGLLNVSCTNLMSNARVIKEESCRIECVCSLFTGGIGIWLQLSNERDLCSGDQWPLWPRSTGSSPMSLHSLLIFTPQLATFFKLNNCIIEPMELIAEISREQTIHIVQYWY